MRKRLPKLFAAPLGALIWFTVSGFAAGPELPQPPLAERIPKLLTLHGHTRVDDYYWLSQRDNPRVIDYLKAENAYTDAVMKRTGALPETLYREMAARIQPDEATVPYLENGFWYYVRYEPGKEYRIYCRKKGSLRAPEEIMLDGNRLAAGHAYFDIGGFDVSPDNRLLAYSVDTVSRRQYRICIKDLRSGRLLADSIPLADAQMLWGGDNRTLFYAVIDDSLRRCKIRRHALGAPASRDRDVFVEKDETFEVRIERSQSRRYLFIVSDSTRSREYRYLKADEPQQEFQVFQPRTPDLLYSVDHLGDRFTILTNDGARNFRVMQADAGKTGRENWQELIAHRPDTLIEDFVLFRNYLALAERAGGLTQLRIIPWGEKEGYCLAFPEQTYVAELDDNPDPDTDRLRYSYESLTSPASIHEFDMKTRSQRLLKIRQVPGYRPEDYVTERLMAPAYDGTPIPISLVYRRGTEKNGQAPLLLYGYGSYGYSTDPTFSANRLSLLDRGFIYAIAHVRGGQEMGRSWYEEGKLFKKMNTFTDFISCAEYLVRHNYTRPERLCANGGSAGGLLMGAVANLRPDLFRAMVAEVPFVDVVTTMLDTSIPLTTSEFDEWGDPRRPECYEYMLSYSPYDNVRPKEYPALLVTTGLHDSQVQYFEPAKWVARLRALKTDDHPLLLRTNMEAGHGGASGRYQWLRDEAFQYAFLIDQLELLLP
jgi:oligopeptidase B